MAEEQKNTVKLTEGQLLNGFAAERANLQALQAQLNAADNSQREIIAATDALNAIKKTKEKEKIVVPLGAGIFIDAVLDSNALVKRNIGGSVVVTSNIEEALKELVEKKQETEKTISLMQKDEERIVTNLNSLGRLLQTIEQHKKREQQAK